MNFYKTLLFSAAISSVGSISIAQEVIRVAEPNWASGRAMSALLTVILEDRMAYQVEQVPGTNAVIFGGMDRGKGEIDVHPDVWMPNQSNFTKEYVDEKKTVALSDHSYSGKQTFCITKNAAEKYGIKSVFDLATPEAAAAFDHDGDGMGEIWLGAPGWTATNQNRVRVRDYGIANFFKPIVAEEEVATAAISAAVNKGEGYAFYCSQPHYNWFVYDMVALDEPPYDPAKYNMINPNEDPEWFEKSSITVAFPELSMFVGYSLSLTDRAPGAVDLFKGIDMDIDTVNQLSYEIVVEQRDSREVAREWVAENSARVDGWLGL